MHNIPIVSALGSNPDPKNRRRLLQFLQNCTSTVVIATHDLDFAAELCEHCVLLHKGTVKSDGATAAMLSDQTLLETYDPELPLGEYFSPC